MLVGNGAEMQKSFNQNRKLLRKRTFLNKEQPRKVIKKQTNKQLSKETQERFDKMEAIANKKAKHLIYAAMFFLAIGLFMFYKLMV